MKSQESQEKKFRQLSDEELEKVTGGITIVPPSISLEKCKDPEYKCSHPEVCKIKCARFS